MHARACVLMCVSVCVCVCMCLYLMINPLKMGTFYKISTPCLFHHHCSLSMVDMTHCFTINLKKLSMFFLKYTHTRTHTQTHTHTHTHMYIYIYNLMGSLQ